MGVNKHESFYRTSKELVFDSFCYDTDDRHDPCLYHFRVSLLGMLCGKVASLNSYLVPEFGYDSSGSYTEPLADIDGTWGHNIEGVFMRLTTGAYVEFPTTGPLGYMYSDQPIAIFANLTNFTTNSGGPATPKK